MVSWLMCAANGQVLKIMGTNELVKANQIMMRHPSMRRVTKMQLTCLMYIPVYLSTYRRTPKVSR